jgi:F-type H+-transporting ATPase subunit b
MQISLMPDLSLFAVMAIFIMNYFVVRKFFLEPVNRVLEEREHETRTSDELYEQAMSRFREATAHIESEVHTAKREAATLRDRFRAEAGTHRATLVQQTQSKAQQIVAEAEAKLGQDVRVARDRIVTEADSLARMAAERILGRAV